MTATVSLEISEYLPSGFSYEGFTFSFRTDNFEDSIEVRKKTPFFEIFHPPKFFKKNSYLNK